MELLALAAASRAEVETTLLIHPRALPAFLDYNEFLPEADRLVRDLGLRGVIQVAGFHPHYLFTGTPQDAAENYTNRSPHPMLHLLREESVTEVAGDPVAMAAFLRRNIETLRRLGRAEMLTRLRATARPGAGHPRAGRRIGLAQSKRIQSGPAHVARRFVPSGVDGGGRCQPSSE
jgi:uncharacterized protein